jgi:AcrR family transcriptional regulator
LRSSSDLPLRRGDVQREAIIEAMRRLLRTSNFEDISVSAISRSAGMTRSGFYFYFDSKHSLLATMLRELAAEIDETTDHFAARTADETPDEFVARMVRGVATVTARNDPVTSACRVARATDERIGAIIAELAASVISAVQEAIEPEVAAGTAVPISDDIPALVRTLSAITQFVATEDPTFVSPDGDRSRALRIVEQLWLHAFWRPEPTHS